MSEGCALLLVINGRGSVKEKEACQVVMTRAGMMIDAMGACRRIQNSLHN